MISQEYTIIVVVCSKSILPLLSIPQNYFLFLQFTEKLVHIRDNIEPLNIISKKSIYRFFFFSRFTNIADSVHLWNISTDDSLRR